MKTFPLVRVSPVVGCLLGCTLAAADAAKPSTPPPGDAPVTLSPFEVTENNRGYYGANTTSGTRLNSKIEDLGASITVITKEQMEDFALLGLNDIFAYEAGTEGTANYTEFSVDQNGAVTDSVNLNPESANRIRGLGAANITFGNFETSGRVPIDPIDVDAVEISRGPNSSIFGIGNTSGTVNSVPASANLANHRTQATLRADSNEGYRTSLEVNRVLIKGRLALRGSAVFQHDESHLKPSGVNTVRLNGMVKYRPFKTTTLSASIADYRMSGQRTNSLTPSDGVTTWLENGRPIFDPTTGIATVNGAAVPLANNTVGSFGNIQIWVDQGKIDRVTFIRTTDTRDPVVTVGNGVYRESNLRVLYPNQPLFITALPVTDRTVYDWRNINLGAANYYNNTAKTMTATLEQVFLATPRQKLAAQAAWLREHTENFSRVAVGIPRSNPTSTLLLVDFNSKLLDGRPNPNLGRPYLSTQPYLELSPAERDDYRAQVAYHLDFREDQGWLRWLGAHDFSTYGEYKDVEQRRLRWRHTIVSNHSWYPAGVARGSNAGQIIGGRPGIPTNILQAPGLRLYVGDNAGGNVDYGPSYFPTGPATVAYGNGATFINEPVEIGSAVANGTGISGNTRNVLKDHGVIWQGHLLQDRIIPTVGWRYDESYTRIGGQFVSRDGIGLDYPSYNSWAPGDWTYGDGPTRTAGIVIRPVRALSLYWNKSDSFRPSTPRQDLYLNRLPDPNGVGKDFGVMMSLFQDRLSLRFNRYITRQLQTPNGPSATFVSRIRRMDFTNYNADSNPGTDPFTLQTVAAGWVQAEAAAQGRALSADELKNRVAAIMKVPLKYLDEPAFSNGAADDTLARGFEFEANFNPTKSWSLKVNLAKQQTLNERIAPELQQWVNERLPVWQSIIDPATGKPWFTSIYGAGTSAALNNAAGFLSANVTSQINQLRATEGQIRPQIRQYRANFITNFRLAGITEQKFLKRCNVGGAVRWEDKGAIGYYGKQQPPAIVTSYDLQRPIYDPGHTYVDLLLGYRTRLFREKVGARFQLNVRNLQENGRLQPIAAFPDGRPYAYRIVEPRVFILSSSFDL